MLGAFFSPTERLGFGSAHDVIDFGSDGNASFGFATLALAEIAVPF